MKNLVGGGALQGIKKKRGDEREMFEQFGKVA